MIHLYSNINGMELIRDIFGFIITGCVFIILIALALTPSLAGVPIMVVAVKTGNVVGFFFGFGLLIATLALIYGILLVFSDKLI